MNTATKTTEFGEDFLLVGSFPGAHHGVKGLSPDEHGFTTGIQTAMVWSH